MKLNKLLDQLDYTLDAGSTDTEISSLEYDSRKVGPGSLFVCLTGFRADGHAYTPAAVEAGAAALVVEREVSAPEGITVIRVKDSRYALALLSAAWFGHPARKMTVIGLTGTKGKTTTAHMVKAILEAAGRKVGMIGTIGALIGQEKVPTKTPPRSPMSCTPCLPGWWRRAAPTWSWRLPLRASSSTAPRASGLIWVCFSTCPPTTSETESTPALRSTGTARA